MGHRVNIWVFHNKALGTNAKRKLYEWVVVPVTLYGAETWNVRVSESNRLDVFEMRSEEYFFYLFIFLHERKTAQGHKKEQ